MEKRFFSARDIACYLGVSESAIRKWIRTDHIKFCRINGAIRFDIKKIDEEIAKGSFGRE